MYIIIYRLYLFDSWVQLWIER